jgi:hypothetical protein
MRGIASWSSSFGLRGRGHQAGLWGRVSASPSMPCGPCLLLGARYKRQNGGNRLDSQPVIVSGAKRNQEVSAGQIHTCSWASHTRYTTFQGGLAVNWEHAVVYTNTRRPVPPPHDNLPNQRMPGLPSSHHSTLAGAPQYYNPYNALKGPSHQIRFA